MQETESKIQQDLITQFNNTYPELRGLLFSVPNGGYRSKREANKLRHEGMTAGIPDLIFAYDGMCYFIEMKTETGVLSDEQKGIIRKLEEQGFIVLVCRSAEKAMDIITYVIENERSRSLMYLRTLDER